MFIAEQQGEFCISRMCAVLDVSVSGYYAWDKRPPSRRSQEHARLLVEVEQIHHASYGSPLVVKALRQGERCNENGLLV